MKSRIVEGGQLCRLWLNFISILLSQAQRNKDDLKMDMQTWLETEQGALYIQVIQSWGREELNWKVHKVQFQPNVNEDTAKYTEPKMWVDMGEESVK